MTLRDRILAAPDKIAAAVCTYDNPATMARECWTGGRLLCHYACSLLPPYAKHPIPAERYFFGANIGRWERGQLVGDAAALPESIRTLRDSLGE